MDLCRAPTPERSIPHQPHLELGIDLELQEPNQPQIHQSEAPIQIHIKPQSNQELQIDSAPTRSPNETGHGVGAVGDNSPNPDIRLTSTSLSTMTAVENNYSTVCINNDFDCVTIAFISYSLKTAYLITLGASQYSMLTFNTLTI